MLEILNEKLIELKKLEAQLEEITTKKEIARKEVLDIIENEKLDQYKNDVATISRVERKTVKFIKSKEEILESLKEQKLVKYFDIVPEQIIPEHELLNKTFDSDAKEGKFSIEGVEIETKTTPMIRFNK